MAERGSGDQAASSTSGRFRLAELVRQSFQDFLTDDAVKWAAAIAYYSLLSLFPLLLALLSLAAYFVEADWATRQVTRLLGDFVPRGEGVIRETIQGALEARETATILSFVALLWTGSRVFGVLSRALNVAFDVDDPYTFWKRLALELGMLATVGLLFILALSSGFWLDLLRRSVQALPAKEGLAYSAARLVFSGLLLLGTFTITYRYVPRARPAWTAASAGAGVATLLYLLAQPLFVYYLQQFARYNLIYGSLSIVIVILVWAWLSAMIVLFGGEAASHVQMMVIEGRSPEEVARRHAERSPAGGRAGRDGGRRSPAAG